MAVEAPLPRDRLDALFVLVRRAFRFWWVAALTMVVGGGLAFLYARTRHERYMSEAVVLYQEGMNFNFAPGEAGPSARRVGQRLRDIVLSRPNLIKLVNDAKLAPAGVSREKLAALVEDVRKAITFRVNEGDTFVISYTAEEPLVAQAVAQRMTDMLIAENKRFRAEQAEVAREFLDAERTRTDEILGAKEMEIARFLARHPEFAQEQATAGTTGAAVRASTRRGQTEPVSGDPALSALRREEARLRQQIASPTPTAAPPADPVLREAEARLSAARRELADRRARFTEQHPDVLSAAAAVREAEANLKRASDRPVPDEVVEIEPRAALQSRLAQVQQEIRRREGRAAETPAEDHAAEPSDAAQRIVALETEWARLNREVGEARERFQALDTRQFAASITAASLATGRAARIVVIDPAYLPAQPTGASKRRVLLAGVAAAAFLGVLAAFALALIDDHVYERREIDALALAPVLVEIPLIRRRRRG